jgi:hypothetical protein
LRQQVTRRRTRRARGGEELVEQGGDPGGGEAGGPGLLEQGGGAAVGDQPPQGPRAAADPPLGQAGDQRRQVAVDQPGHRPCPAAGRGRRVEQLDLAREAAVEAQAHVAGGQVGRWRPGGQGGEQGQAERPGVPLEQGGGGHGEAVGPQALGGQLELEVELDRDRAEQVAGGQPDHGSATSSRALRTVPKTAAWGRSGRSA